MPVNEFVGMKRVLAHFVARIMWLALVAVLTDLKSA